MTAISQNLTLGSVTLPIAPQLDPVAAEVAGVTADTLFLQVMDWHDPVEVTPETPQIIVASQTTASASAPMPVPPELADELPVAETAALSPLAQIFMSAPVPMASTPRPDSGPDAQTDGAVPTRTKKPNGAGSVPTVPLFLGGDAQTAVVQRPDSGAQPLTGDALAAAQSQTFHVNPADKTQAFRATVAPQPADPAAGIGAAGLLPPPDQATAVRTLQLSPPPLDKTMPLLAENAVKSGQVAQVASVATADQPGDLQVRSTGTGPVSNQAALNRGSAKISGIESGIQSDPSKPAKVIHTSIENAWQQKWLGVPAGAATPSFAAATQPPAFADATKPPAFADATKPPAFADATQPPVVPMGSGHGSGVAGLAAPAEIELPLERALLTAPAKSSEDEPAQPGGVTAFAEQAVLPADPLRNSESSPVAPLDPSLRAAGKDVLTMAITPTATPILTPTIVEMARSGNDGPIELALAPEELGRLTISIRQEGDFVRVSMLAERPETLDLLRRHAGDLLADLRQSGFSGASFSFGPGGQDRPPQVADTSLDAGDAAAPQSAPHDFKQPTPSRSPKGAGLDLRL